MISDPDMLAQWMAVHGAHETRRAMYTCVRAIADTRPRHVCGAGRGYHERCASRGGWIDHARAFVRDRRAAIYVSQPYGYDARDLVAVCRRFDLACFLYPRAESWYYPGGTYLIVFVASSDRDRYLDDEARRSRTPTELLTRFAIVGAA